MTLLHKTAAAFSFVALGLIAAALVFIGAPSPSEPAEAAVGDNVYGWAWNDTIGWISFNCTNDASCGSSSYGVTVANDGGFSGNAWNDKVGWISFNRSETGNPPGQPYQGGGGYIARYNSGNNQIDGWAKILSMGNDGWIKLRRFSSDSGVDYGLSITSTGDFSGWAWHGNNAGSALGWISFNCATDSSGSCGTSNYKVVYDLPPTVTDTDVSPETVSEKQAVYCSNTVGSTPVDARRKTLSWVFSDTAGQAQGWYRVRVWRVGGGNPTIYDSGKTAGAATQKIVTAAEGLAYGTNYDWSIQVWDENNNASNVVGGDAFTTELHNYPLVEAIASDPTQPRALEDTMFAATAVTYGNSTIGANNWLFSSDDTTPASLSTSTASATALGGGATRQSTTEVGPFQFSSQASDNEMEVRVTDSSGYTCSVEQTVESNISLPIWRETKAR